MLTRKPTVLITACLLILSALVGCDESSLTAPDAPTNSPSEPASASSDVEPELLTLDSGVRVEKRNDKYFWQGDIVLSEAQFESLNSTGAILSSSGSRNAFRPDSTVDDPTKGWFSIPGKGSSADEGASTNSFGIYPDPYRLWSMVRYVLSPSLSYSQKQTIANAMDHWEANTDVRFYNATGEPTVHPEYGFEYPYVYFISGSGNYSSVGRIGGKQDLSITPFASRRTVIHEIGHAIGLFHEQSRVDRNDYITVNYDNIKPGKEYNFDRETENYSFIGPFDFNSVMIYGSYAFSRNGNPTITKKDGSTFSRNNTLSTTDIGWADEFYYPYEE